MANNSRSATADPLRPSETVPAQMPRAPREPLPAFACDTHSHVFGPYDTFAFATPSSYPPPLAPAATYQEMLATIGAQRGVLVQPAPYGTDNTALVAALRAGGGRIRGVAVTDANVSDAALESLHASGVRALRFNEMPSPQTGKPFAGSVGVDTALALASRMKMLGWHAQVWARCADVPAIAERLGKAGLPVVFEHMTCFDPTLGVAHRDFANVLALLREGRIAVKLALCRVSKQPPDYEDLRPFHDRLVEANAKQLVWSSDWPFVRMGDAAPDVGALLDTFQHWVDDSALRQAILVDNPARIYRFEN
ncbi:putative TIM-barrel fold metal-dependent hydrolase [Paraburkholderia unamae]|uniref:amidohydrolase family protein n=1 Tax=Paraburkholderia unamae TaxID=219649 RepID=UPI000DC5A682|nr:amidohydrolase family protein [Paraburkholderia unamae]RAR61235.1 putative TIM-barrel fold metal-dependent hydrolase [Paraburkholderia unamae]